MSPNNIFAAIGQNILPKARTSDIVVQEVDKDTLVYDLTADKAHHLNKTLSLVWEKCDGKTTFDELARILKNKLNIKVESDFIWLALSELEKSNLLEAKFEKQNFEGLTRRKVLFKYALPTLMLPIIVSLVAPQAVQAQSCPPGLGMAGTPCFDTTDCCPGLTCVQFLGVIGAGTCQSSQVINF